MNIEHLVEPKLKDLEKEIENLRHLRHIDHAIEIMEHDSNYGPHYGPPVKGYRNGSIVVEKKSGPYLIQFQIQKL